MLYIYIYTHVHIYTYTCCIYIVYTHDIMYTHIIAEEDMKVSNAGGSQGPANPHLT